MSNDYRDVLYTLEFAQDYVTNTKHNYSLCYMLNNKYYYDSGKWDSFNDAYHAALDFGKRVLESDKLDDNVKKDVLSTLRVNDMVEKSDVTTLELRNKLDRMADSLV